MIRDCDNFFFKHSEMKLCYQNPAQSGSEVDYLLVLIEALFNCFVFKDWVESQMLAPAVWKQWMGQMESRFKW